ncbi:MAG: flagellar type III secretion system pore protein FliP [Phycisphaerales bacterium]
MPFRGCRVRGDPRLFTSAAAPRKTVPRRAHSRVQFSGARGGLSTRTIAVFAALLLAWLTLPVPSAGAQEAFGPPLPGLTEATPLTPDIATTPGPFDVLAPGPMTDGADPMNPAAMLARAGQTLPGAQGSQTKGLSAALNIVIVLTVLALAPSIMLLMTCFLRIVIVLSLLKQALGTQQMPPSQVLLGLALVMTLVVMAPTLDRINREAVEPYRSGQITDYTTLWDKTKQPLRDFMFDQIEATGNYSSLYMVLNQRGIDTSRPETLTRASVDMVSLVPAFVLSEMKVAFLMGFKVYLPFLVIDMVISSLLISMSMMMLPPVLISLPFKLLLFVLVDGWQLIVGSLMSSFAVPGTAGAVPGTVAAAAAAFQTLLSG